MYRGYLQIDSGAPHCAFTPAGQTLCVCPTSLTAVGCFASCDLTRIDQPALWFITWDPTQPIATRPLAIRKDGTWFAYGWDLTKNICEVFGPAGYIRTAYSYSPYGKVANSGDVEQPIQWSSEFNDKELALTYYNYRHYNSESGRWIGRDFLSEKIDKSLYVFASNATTHMVDVCGLAKFPQRPLIMPQAELQDQMRQ